MKFLCRFGIHRWCYIGIFTWHDAFNLPYSFSIGVCKFCPKCQMRFVKPQKASDVVEWALKFEAMGGMTIEPHRPI